MIKMIIPILGTLISLVLYCCLIQGKKEDEWIEKMHRKSQTQKGKDKD